MRLISASLRNYRLHRELDVEFASGLSLIGGPNESGKSTLVEALHRGLFLRARATGEIQRSMVSRLSGAGAPEVTVRFACGDVIWRVSKRFSGASGTTLLQREGGQTLHDAEAEERLHQLLRVEEVGTGRGIAERLLNQWSHLWVWQGKSGDDPSLCSAGDHPQLIQKLQQIGGAAAMVSAADDAAARRFAAQRETLFLQSGKPRKGSPLEQAEAELAEAEVMLETVRQRIADREKTVRQFEAAVATLGSMEASRERLRSERKENDAALEQIRTLLERERVQAAAAHQAAGDLKNAEEADRQIRSLTTEEAALRQKIAPLKEALDGALTEQAALIREVEATARSLAQARSATRTARRQQEWLRAHLRVASARDARQRAAELHQQVSASRQKERTLTDELATLPTITEKDLAQLRSAEADLGRARAALAAMATGIELVSADGPVLLDGQHISAGMREVLTAPGELTAGGLRLRITPGGGENLATARDAVARSSAAFDQLLANSGVKSLEAAVAIVSRRTLLQQDIERERLALRHLEADRADDRLRDAEQEVEAAQAELARKLTALPEPADAPADAEACRICLAELSDHADATETEERRLEGELKATETRRKSLEDAVVKQRDTLLAAQQQADDRRSRLEVLVGQQGTDEARAAKLDHLKQQEATTKQALAATRSLLEQLDPDTRQRDKVRLERAWEQNEKLLREAEATRAVAQAELQSDGRENPHALLAEAEARSEQARASAQHVRRHAAAIRLIDELFAEAQQALSDTFSRPLADRITRYLRAVFGAGARAEVQIEQNKLTGIRLTRGDRGEDAFSELSGGAREQLAAAVRLAMAELLAVDHAGCLPVVFDDAFAASDPGRIQAVQRMLDHAAAQGLQVILLSCNPSEYASLGAHSVFLPTPPA